ncbi:TrmH family RNA methyltransferase [Streptomyces sp. ODS28]|uniref:TrmH family RNA methyltransferase n=1 Tax=Streptomyces sp. ODS28 TaxID=3136688 RepID=UPI0031F0F707
MRRWREHAEECVLLDGFHALKHALRFGARVPVAVAEDRAAALALAGDLAPDLTAELDGLLGEIPAERLRHLVPKPHPTGVAALAFPGGREDPLLDRAAPLVVLDNPRHLGNIGAVVRLAAGAGAAGVLTTGTVDPWHPTVVRAGAGLHFATAVQRRDPGDLPPGPLYALDPEGTDLRETGPLPDDALLAFGSERHGLSAGLRERADHLVALPMQPQVSSYNLATSVAMTLYHWMAQRPR